MAKLITFFIIFSLSGWLKKFPVLNPFFDQEVIASVRMEPKDLGNFPMEHWYLANNSFLLHGYYYYRHLLFMKMKL